MSGGGPGRRPRVVIIGGGLAGLAAAEALARHPAGAREITLLESKRRTGGRAGSFTDTASSTTVDYCQHVAMGCCTNLTGLLERCGLSDELQRHRELQFRHPESRPSRFVPSRRLPPPLHLAAALMTLRYLTRSDKQQIVAALWRLMRTPRAGLRTERAGEWLRAAGQSDRAIRRFWDVILVSALAERTDAVSMAAARKVLIDGFAAARSASDLLVPRRPLSQLFGHLLPAAIERLGVAVRTSAAVRRVRCSELRRLEIETAGGERLRADHVILAVPWHAVEPLLGDAAARLGWSPSSVFTSTPITGMHLWLDRPITDRPHTVLVGTTAQWLFHRPAPGLASADTSIESGHYYQIVISAAHSVRRGDNAELIRTVMMELGSVFPAAEGARVLRSRVVTDPHAVFSITPDADGARPPARTAIAGLHLAGDWIATGWPATMESAVIGGRMAAASVAESEGLAPPAIDPGLPRGWLARRLIRP